MTFLILAEADFMLIQQHPLFSFLLKNKTRSLNSCYHKKHIKNKKHFLKFPIATAHDISHRKYQSIKKNFSFKKKSTAIEARYDDA